MAHYNTVRAKGMPDDDNAVLTKIVDKDGTNKAIITENGELKVAITGDFTLGNVQIDNVHIVDKDGNEIQLDSDGAMTVTTEDGKNVALGSTTDTDTANTVIGLIKALKALATSLDNKDFATETTQATLATEAKLETVRVLLNTISGIDFATETTLSAIKDTDGIKKITDDVNTATVDGNNVALGSTTDLSTDNTVIGLLKALDTLITSLEGKDYSTETTLATLATETKLEACRILLETISNLDFSSETTLAAIKDTDGIKKIIDTVATSVADGSNVALGTTTDTSSDNTVIGLLKALDALLTSIDGKDFATQTTLSALKTLFDNGTALAKHVQPDTMSATSTSVTTSAASIVSADSSRMEVTIQNMSSDTNVKIGQASDQCNFTLLPQSAITLDYTGVLYAVVDSGSATVQILDLS